MQRRQFLSLATASVIVPASLRPAHAGYSAVEYEWGMRADLRDNGQTVVYNFRSSWSLTCEIKERLLGELKSETPAYRDLSFIDVDFDTYGPSQWVERLKVRRRSTLVVMKGSTEIARVENEPHKERLRVLLDQALAA